MIDSIRGILVTRDPTGIVIETGGGVGYHIDVPLGVFERLPAQGSPVCLHTELVVREDAWLLFGFDSVEELSVFRRLMGASGIGPRLALAMLSSLGSDRTVRAVREKDIAVLSSVPGIGRKKAERIILEMGDRLDHLPVSVAPSPGASPAADAVRALIALGYPVLQAETAVRTVTEAGSQQDTGLLVRRALTELTRKK